MPTYEQARDDAAADLIIFVVSNLLANGFDACGAAEGSPTSTIDLIADLTTGQHLLNSNLKFVGYVAAFQPQCATTPFAIVATHEIGHLLYAEHEVIYENGQAVGEVGSNGDVLKPFKQNHPAVAGSERTIMYSTGPSFGGELFSKQNARFSNFDDAFGEYEDVARIMSDTSYQYVAHYRIPKPPPPSCKLQYEFASCNGTVAIGNVTAILAGYTVTLSDFDISTNSGGSWTDLYTGLVSCPGTPVYPNLFTRVRALLTTAYGISQCEIPIQINNCEGGGGGPNPF